MKRMMMAIGLATLATTATAGGGCINGSHAAMDEEKQVLASAEETDPAVLARLQAKAEAEALEKLLETPVIHN